MSAETGLTDFAFSPRLTPPPLPRAFTSLDALADHIERIRHGQTIQLIDIDTVEIPGRPGLFRAVQINTQLIDGTHDRCLGFAWLGGVDGRDRLQPALQEARRRADRRQAESRQIHFVGRARRREILNPGAAGPNPLRTAI